MKEQSMFKEVGYMLIGAAFQVDDQLNFGAAEEVCQQTLEIESTLPH
jgi:hypothetical protein